MWPDVNANHPDASGAFLGSVTVDGYPETSADGTTFTDDNAQVMVTIRDAAGAVMRQMSGAGAPAVTGIRMGVGSPGFPDSAGGAATPTA